MFGCLFDVIHFVPCSGLRGPLMVPTTRPSIGSSTQATISTGIAGAADDPIEGRVAGRRFDVGVAPNMFGHGERSHEDGYVLSSRAAGSANGDGRLRSVGTLQIRRRTSTSLSRA